MPKKGKIFSRVAKEIISAVKVGGGPDPKTNPRLRIALQKARMPICPNDNIDRNIKKASSADQADFHEMTYEFYGHGGVGIIVDVMTDNKNRSLPKCASRQISAEAQLPVPGAVAFNFDRKGVIQISKKTCS